jgi:hypothetical protein
MVNKKRVIEDLVKFLCLAPTLLSLAQHLKRLLYVEAKLAKRNLFFIIILSLCVSAGLTVTWFGLLASLSAYLISLQWSILPLLSMLLTLNIFVLLLLFIAVLLV